MLLTSLALILSLALLANSVFSKFVFKIFAFALLCILAFVPIYKSDFLESYSFAQLLYSFFDEPSLFAICLLIFAFLNVFFFKKTYNPLAFVLIFIFSTVAFLSNLDLVFARLFYDELFYMPFIFVFLLCLYFCDKKVAFIALFSVLVGGGGSFENVLFSLFCVYLWLFSLFKTVVFIIVFLRKKR